MEGAIDYSEHGRNWSGLCIGGPEQSPINIDEAKVVPNMNIRFELVNYQDFQNEAITLHHDNSMITVHNTQETDSDIHVWNERGEMQEYHYSYMQWKVPSEHNINNRALAAEL